jgi:serpin B
MALFGGASFMHTDAQIRADQATSRDSVAAVVAAGNRFAFDLYSRERHGAGNLFFSPASISVALAMGYVGAAGNTATEMAQTLHIDMPKEQLNREMRTLLAWWRRYDSEQRLRLKMANRLWGQEGFAFLPEYLRVTRDDYGAELAQLDFRRTEAARQTINNWVEQQTGDKIRNLVASPDMLLDANLVLTNAAYFQGAWTAKFQESLTAEQDFHVTADQRVKIPLMRQTDRFRYAAVDGLQLIELPYRCSSLSMIVLLPDRPEGLSELEARLTATSLQKWIQAAGTATVEVFLPKFKLTALISLADTLAAMGMPSAFDRRAADFSGMTGGKELFFFDAIHKAFVDVDEKGTEAAAATVGFCLSATFLEPITQPPVFRADHPFVFLICDNRIGAILFLGRVVDPTQ